MNPRLFHHIRHIRSCSAAETRDDNLDILLAGGAVGAWLAWFTIIFSFWYFGAIEEATDKALNYPEPVNFTVEGKLLAIRDDHQIALAIPNVVDKSAPNTSAEKGPQ